MPAEDQQPWNRQCSTVVPSSGEITTPRYHPLAQIYCRARCSLYPCLFRLISFPLSYMLTANNKEMTLPLPHMQPLSFHSRFPIHRLQKTCEKCGAPPVWRTPHWITTSLVERYHLFEHQNSRIRQILLLQIRHLVLAPRMSFGPRLDMFFMCSVCGWFTIQVFENQYNNCIMGQVYHTGAY